jgi:hypothetical protein
MLLDNNFVIPWNFAWLNYNYSSIVEFITDLTWVSAKISFYAAFAFQSMAVLDLITSESESANDNDNNHNAQTQLQIKIEQRKTWRVF